MATLNKIVEQLDAALKAVMPNATEAQIETIIELVQGIAEAEAEDAVENFDAEDAISDAMDDAGYMTERDFDEKMSELDLDDQIRSYLDDIDVDDYFDIEKHVAKAVKSATREAIDNLCDELDLTLANAKANMAEQRVKEIEATLAGSFWSRLRWLFTGKIGGVK